MEYSVETPAGTFDSFTEAAEAGYPVACQGFLLCENAAVDTIENPILTAVAVCERCRERLTDE